MAIRSSRDLDVWVLGKRIVVEMYATTKGFPKEETYGLSAQMRRAAVSIPSNIAEGFNRQHNKEYRQFLHVALGSCGELETQVEVSKDLGYLGEEERARIVEQLDHEGRMLRRLISKIS